MFTENFTNWQLGLPSDEVVGGWMMEPKDALRIAQKAKFGLCYKPEEQLPHGGMVFKGGIGGNIPFYNPDHGPTVSEEDSIPPVPPELRHIAEKWIDPYQAIDLDITASISTAAEEGEIMEEEAIRKLAAEKSLASFGISVLNEITFANAELEPVVDKKRLKDSKAVYYDNLRFATVDDLERAAVYEDENAQMEAKNAEETQERDLRVKKTLETLETVASGQARSQRAVISYAIETIRDMQSEISRAEQDVATKRRAGRRRQRKGGSDAENIIGSAEPLDITSGGGRGGGDYGGGGGSESIF